MKKFLLLTSLFGFLLSNAQTSEVAPAAKTYTKKKRKYRHSAIKNYTGVDSATIYYNLGWDNYKLDSMGPARYYWDMATKAPGKWENKNAAYYRLGVMQEKGEGMDVNTKNAMEFYQKACGYGKRLGDANAMKAIAAMYENGTGVTTNYAMALRWYQKAKAAGHESVDEDITRLKERIKGK